MKQNTKMLSKSAIIAALYVVLTYIATMTGLSSGVIQVRFSEMLTVLPAFTPAAVPGLFLGCLVANLLSGCVIWDVVFGSLTTLLAAILTRALKKYKWLAPVPPILCNALTIPFILSYAYGAKGSIPFFMLTVGIGELISCGVLGTLFTLSLKKTEKYIRL